MTSPSLAAPPERLGVALSGGGFRAAAFHLGVLRGLRDVGLLSEVDVISGISGGALLAAAWVVGGREDLDAFTERMRRFLGRDLKTRILLAAARPDRLARLLVDPHYSLTEVLGQVLDRELYHGATLGQLAGVRPRLVVSATSVNNGTGFRFSPDSIGDWKLRTTSRQVLDRFPVARAVVASAAFPGGFSPVVLSARKVFPGRESCPREVLLTDGGVDDNLGIQALAGCRCSRIVVSDATFPFVDEPRPLNRFGLSYPRRLVALCLATALAFWATAALDVPAILAGAMAGATIAVTLRLRFAVWLFGSVAMRGQRRGLLRRLFGQAARLPFDYVGLETALSPRAEAELRSLGIDAWRLRRIRTDLALKPRDVDDLIALGETLVRERLGPKVSASAKGGR